MDIVRISDSQNDCVLGHLDPSVCMCHKWCNNTAILAVFKRAGVRKIHGGVYSSCPYNCECCCVCVCVCHGAADSQSVPPSWHLSCLVWCEPPPAASPLPRGSVSRGTDAMARVIRPILLGDKSGISFLLGKTGTASCDWKPKGVQRGRTGEAPSFGIQ